MTAQILYCHPPQNQPPTKHSADDTDSHLSLKTKPINLYSELCTSSGRHQTFPLICDLNFEVAGSLSKPGIKFPSQNVFVDKKVGNQSNQLFYNQK